MLIQVHNDGLWVIDSLGAGSCRLLVSLAQLMDSNLFSGLPLGQDSSTRLHGMHAEFSPDEKMLLFVVRSDASSSRKARSSSQTTATTSNDRGSSRSLRSSRPQRHRRNKGGDNGDNAIMHHAIVMGTELSVALRSGDEQLQVSHWRRVLSWRDGEGSHPTWAELGPASILVHPGGSDGSSSSGSSSSNDSSSTDRKGRKTGAKGAVTAELVMNLQWPSRTHPRSVVACHVRSLPQPERPLSSPSGILEGDQRKERCRLLGPCGSGYPVMVRFRERVGEAFLAWAHHSFFTEFQMRVVVFVIVVLIQ